MPRAVETPRVRTRIIQLYTTSITCTNNGETFDKDILYGILQDKLNRLYTTAYSTDLSTLLGIKCDVQLITYIPQTQPKFGRKFHDSILLENVLLQKIVSCVQVVKYAYINGTYHTYHFQSQVIPHTQTKRHTYTYTHTHTHTHIYTRMRIYVGRM